MTELQEQPLHHWLRRCALDLRTGSMLFRRLCSWINATIQPAVATTGVGGYCLAVQRASVSDTSGSASDQQIDRLVASMHAELMMLSHLTSVFSFVSCQSAPTNVVTNIHACISTRDQLIPNAVPELPLLNKPAPNCR